jgi:6-phosphogluconolactonase (cycloisomerase 2 family)
VALATLVAAASLTPTLIAHAATTGHEGGGAVFVQTNDPHGNAIVVYDRTSDGTLTLDSSHATGGKGGRAAGSTSDPLASQGSLLFDREQSLLFAVNAGSDSISVFSIDGDVVALQQVTSSGGEFPVSLAFHGDRLVVLNAGGKANVTGFRIRDSRVHRVPGDTRALGLTEADPPAFLASPAQVGFTPDGRQLLVTGKTNDVIDVFAVTADGGLSSIPVRTTDGAVPFAFLFSPSNQLDLVNAAGNVAPGRVHANGTIALGAPVPDGQIAACWIARVGDYGYVANTGSNDVSEYRIAGSGAISLVDATAATGIPGAIDETSAAGRHLYVLSALSSSVRVYDTNHGASLTLLQTIAVPDGASAAGIAA